jgi:hypothetical protein
MAKPLAAAAFMAAGWVAGWVRTSLGVLTTQPSQTLCGNRAKPSGSVEIPTDQLYLGALSQTTEIPVFDLIESRQGQPRAGVSLTPVVQTFALKNLRAKTKTGAV